MNTQSFIQIFTLYWTCLGHVLEFVSFMTHNYYTLCFSHCNISQYLMQQQKSPYTFLMTFSYYFSMLWQLLTKTVNSILSHLTRWKFCGNHKRTQQRVSNVFLYYMYYYYKFYPKLCMLFIILYYYYKANMPQLYLFPDL